MTSRDVSGFEEFVRFASEVKNHHWQPQFLYLPDELDFVGRVETFDHDFQQLCGIIGEEVPQPSRVNATEREAHWKYYTPALAELVTEMYARDIAEFGYRFDEAAATPDISKHGFQPR